MHGCNCVTPRSLPPLSRSRRPTNKTPIEPQIANQTPAKPPRQLHKAGTQMTTPNTETQTRKDNQQQAGTEGQGCWLWRQHTQAKRMTTTARPIYACVQSKGTQRPGRCTATKTATKTATEILTEAAMAAEPKLKHDRKMRPDSVVDYNHPTKVHCTGR